MASMDTVHDAPNAQKKVKRTSESICSYSNLGETNSRPQVLVEHFRGLPRMNLDNSQDRATANCKGIFHLSRIFVKNICQEYLSSVFV